MSRADEIPLPNLSSLSFSKKRDEPPALISVFPTTSDPTTSPNPLAAIRSIESFRFRPYDDSESAEALQKRRELEKLKLTMVMGIYDIDSEPIDDANKNLVRNRKKLEFVNQQLESFPELVPTYGVYSNNNQDLLYYSHKQEELRTLFEKLATALTLAIQAAEARESAKAATSAGYKTKEEMDVEETIAKIKAIEKKADLKFENESQDDIFQIVDETFDAVSKAVDVSNNPAEETRMKIAFVRSGIQRLNERKIPTTRSLMIGEMEKRGLESVRRQFVNLMTELEVLLNKLVDYYASADSGSASVRRIARQRSESDALDRDERARKQRIEAAILS